MNIRGRGPGFRARLIVQAASLAVPREQREDWTAEWLAELCHVTADAGPIHPVDFAAGAIQDALWLRREALHAALQSATRRGSAIRCGLILAGSALGSLLLCLSLASARSTLYPLPYGGGRDLVLVSADGQTVAQTPTIRLSRYREWHKNARHIMPQLAYYRPEQQRLRIDRHHTARIQVALCSSNLFRVLGLPASKGRSGTRLVFSRSAWRRYFGANAKVGQLAELNGAAIPIVEVLPDHDWRLPGKADAWLLDDAADLAQMPAMAKGFVVARIRTSAFPQPRSGVWIMQQTIDGITSYFDCVSIGYWLRLPDSAFLFALLLAAVALPATTALPLGSYPLHTNRLPRTVNGRRWAFLAMKFLMLLCTAYCSSVAVVYGVLSLQGTTALYLEIGLAFPALLFGFRWALTDQRQRCPVCLRLLSNPARVGQASCNFLAWNGVELFCAGGHGLLHIPEMPTSWFSCQRWLCLDSSWMSLFPEATESI